MDKLRHATMPAPAVRKDGNKLYFAYGSNLNIAAMRHRCPRAVPLYPILLSDSALVFRGVADVVYRRGAVCPGGVWLITPQCEESLDRYEGVKSGLYVKRYFPLAMRKSKLVRPVLYYQMREAGRCPPAVSYLETIEEGYHNFGLDPAYLEAALDEAWADPKVTPRLAQRYDRKGRPQLANCLRGPKEEQPDV